MNDISLYFLLGFAFLFGIVFKDILFWFDFKPKDKDVVNIILFFPAFFFLLAYWFMPFFISGQFAVNDITKISTFQDGLLLWIAVSLFVGAGARLLFEWAYNKFQ